MCLLIGTVSQGSIMWPMGLLFEDDKEGGNERIQTEKWGWAGREILTGLGRRPGGCSAFIG